MGSMRLHLAALLVVLLFICTNNAHAQTAALFSSNDSIGCAPLNISFVNNSTGANSYVWDFGNGNSSTLANPSNIYTTTGTYTVTLIAINTTTGARDTIQKTNYVQVIDPPVADFFSTITSGCINNAVIAFTNTSTNSVSWIWDFGDGNSSTAQNPTHAYAGTGTYTVKLIAVNAYNCNNIKIRNAYITINPKPTAGFTATPTTLCDSSMAVNFMSNSTGASSWLWNLGNGQSSTLQNPSLVYGATGNYNVTLTVSNTFGCKDTLMRPAYIKISPAPPVTFASSNISGCAPLNVTFGNTTTGTTAWLWNFGNGQSSSLQNPTTTYSTPGTYSVTLTATHSSGCLSSSTKTNYITVLAGPIANFTANNTTGCKPVTANFVNLSVNAVSWLWDFGDGTTSTAQNPVKTYNTSGNFTVTLTAYSANGCSATFSRPNIINVQSPVAQFTNNYSVGCSPLTITFTNTSTGGPFTSYLWNFGNGQTSTLQNPSATYTALGDYTVSLIITNAAGCKDTIVKPNIIQVVSGSTSYTPPPTSYVCNPYSSVFSDPTTGSSNWLWDFGDGSTSANQNPSHTFNTPGTYTVNLVTQMPGGCSQTFSPFAVIVVMGPEPVMNISVVPSMCPPHIVNCSVTAPGATSFLWKFGDGDSSTLQNPTHTYLASGPYTITLTVGSAGPASMTGQGDTICFKTLSKNISLGTQNPILANQNEVCTGDTIQFTCSFANMVSYFWNFQDGTTSTLQNPKKSYSASGNYSVTLTLTDSTGCTKTFTISPKIKVFNPKADFTTNGNTYGCDSLTVSFQNLSLNSTAYLWNFGNGVTSTQANPTYTYTTPGTYSVSLTAIKNGCSNIKTIVNIVTVTSPSANFTYTQTNTCFPMTVSFTSQAPSATAYLWNFGNGMTSTLANPSTLYTTPPSGPVTLTITDISGCQKTVTKPLIYFNANFTASTYQGCIPLTTTFNPAVTTANTYYWNFGDGSTSNLASPTHTYTVGGVFDVTLIITSTAGCSDTITYPGFITGSQPVAEFNSPTLAACAPTLINFQDLSTSDVTTWLWDFGDGTNSNNQNPAHIYNVAGYYTITLIISNNLGCVDTLTKVDYIAIPGPISSFVAAPLIGCGSVTTMFTDSSYNAQLWSWNFGDGNSSTQQNPSHTYTNVGSYTPALITQDSLGCVSYYNFPQPVVVNPVPTASGTHDGTAGCNPYAVNFSDNASVADSLMWVFDDGNFTVGGNVSHTYSIPGTYNPYVVAFNSFGCTDTLLLPLVVVNATPIPSFTTGQDVGCPPFNAFIANTSTYLVSPSYLWNFSNGNTSTNANPNILFVDPGYYDITLTITNSNGCSASVTRPGFIKVWDEIPPPVSEIFAVSVQTDTQVDIRFARNPAPDLMYYIIYRLNTVTQQYDTIQVIPSSINVGFTYDTVFTDNGLNTLKNVYTYKLQTVDSCGYTIGLDSLNAHSTIDVEAVAQSTNIFVSWNSYGGCQVSSYDIFRTEVATGNTVLVANVPSDSLNYLDNDDLCPVTYSYRIQGLDLCGNPISSFSDTSQATPDNILQHQKVDVVRGTVIDNKNVLVEWKAPTVAADRVAYYNIYRSTNSSNLQFLATVPAGVYDFIDARTEVDRSYYFYQIEVVNFCNISTILSNLGSSVLLKAKRLGEGARLDWTPYSGWDTGVDSYVIEKQNNQGQWIILKTVNPSTLTFDDN